MKNVGIKDFTKAGKSLIFMAALLLAMLVAWFIADRLASLPEKVDIESCIEESALKYGIQPSLIRAIIWRESKYETDTEGKAKEIGLMQITPSAVEDWCKANKRNAPSRRSLFKPSLNIEIGTWYLAQAGKHWNEYKSKEILQISEYNAGYGNVSKNWKPKSPDIEVKISDITIASTREYVKTVLQKKAEYDKKEIR